MLKARISVQRDRGRFSFYKKPRALPCGPTKAICISVSFIGAIELAWKWMILHFWDGRRKHRLARLLVHQSAIYVASKAAKFPERVEIRYFDDRDWITAHSVAQSFDESAVVQPGPSNTETKGAIEVWLPQSYKGTIYSRWVYEGPYHEGAGEKNNTGLITSLFCK